MQICGIHIEETQNQTEADNTDAFTLLTIIANNICLNFVRALSMQHCQHRNTTMAPKFKIKDKQFVKKKRDSSQKL